MVFVQPLPQEGWRVGYTAVSGVTFSTYLPSFEDARLTGDVESTYSRRVSSLSAASTCRPIPKHARFLFQFSRTVALHGSA